MILFGEDYWQQQRPVYPLLSRLAEGRAYSRMIHITDSVNDVVRIITEFEPA